MERNLTFPEKISNNASGSLIVLTGIPLSGKTVVGQYLGGFEGIHYLPAIATGLEGKAQRGELDAGEVFDELVMLKELERDEEIRSLLQEYQHVVVEQWHIGNLAFARLRNPSVAERYEEKLQERLQWFDVWVFYLSLSPEEMAYKLGKDDDAELTSFYKNWLRELSQILKSFDLPLYTLDGSAPLENIKKRATFLLQHELGYNLTSPTSEK